MSGQHSSWSAKARHSRAYAGLFLIFLACGLAVGAPVGRSLFRSNRHQFVEALRDQASLVEPTTGQNSWLIIGVDDLEAAVPHLLSTWLALFFPGQPAVTLLPVFPVPEADALFEGFSLDRQGAPSAGFLEALHGKRLWWNGYIVLDAESLNQLVDYLDDQESNRSQKPALQGSGEGGLFERENAASLWDQTYLLVSSCRQANGLFNPAQAIQMAAYLSPHLRTDLDLAQVARAWPLTEAGRLKVDCELPVMAVSR